MAADFDLNERFILAVKQRLVNGLEQTIEQVNAERSANTDPPVIIDPPSQILDAPPVPGQLNAGFPIVAIADGDITFTDDVGWGATGEYILTLLAYVSDPDPVALAWKLRRYAQVMVTLALYGRNMDYGAWGTGLRRVVPGTRLSRQDPSTSRPSFMSWIGVEIWGKDEQNTP